MTLLQVSDSTQTIKLWKNNQKTVRWQNLKRFVQQSQVIIIYEFVTMSNLFHTTLGLQQHDSTNRTITVLENI